MFAWSQNFSLYIIGTIEFRSEQSNRGETHSCDSYQSQGSQSRSEVSVLWKGVGVQVVAKWSDGRGRFHVNGLIWQPKEP